MDTPPEGAEVVRSIPHMFFHTAATARRRVAFKEHGGDGREWTYGALADAVRELALGFSTLGIGPGDRVGLFADNSIRWILSDLAIQSLGAADVPRGTDTSPAEFDYLIRHSGARVIVLQDRKILNELAPVLEDIADLQCVVLQQGTFKEGDPRPVLSLDEVRARGQERIAEGASLGPLLDRVEATDAATIVYTSGTTGKPKGVVLSHANILHIIRSIPDLIAFEPDDKFLSILPAWHMFERLIEYAAIARGCCTVYTSKRAIKRDLKQERPTVMAAVPRVWELLYEEARRQLSSGPAVRRSLVSGLLQCGVSYRRSKHIDPSLGRPAVRWTRLLQPLHRLGERLIYQQFRAALGGQLRVAVSGGGSLPFHVDEFYDLAGIPILNGYGLTETAPLVSVRRLESPTLRTSGVPITDTIIEIRDAAGRPVKTGEIGIVHVHGPQVMAGYYRDLKSTRAVFDARGFFDTGDLGRLFPNGELEITGRAKDTIVLCGGENVEPEPIENALRMSPLIDQVVVIGQDQKQLGVLIVPDRDALRERMPVAVGAGAYGAPGPGDAEFDPEIVRGLIKTEIERLVTRERGFKPYELVRRFAILDAPFSIASQELTETQKLRRHEIVIRRRDAIEALYGS